MSTISQVRERFVSGVRQGAGVAPEVRFVLRFMGVLVFVTFALTVHLWARMGVRQTAIRLDEVHSELGRQVTLQDRLLVERTMLRSPGKLGGIAAVEGLVAPVLVVDVAARSVVQP